MAVVVFGNPDSCEILAGGVLLFLCYLDEAGCTGALPTAFAPIQPVFAIAGVAIPESSLHDTTLQFIELKRRFFPALMEREGPEFLSAVLVEIKGAELRKAIALGDRDERRHAIGFLDRVLELLEEAGARVFGRVWVKAIGEAIDGTALYTFSVQDICRTFETLLRSMGMRGLLIADSRTKQKNERVAHSIFTQKFRERGDPLTHLVEMPTFGHSDNHVGLQLADLLCSAWLFPMAVHTYCTGFIHGVHVRPGYALIRERYGERIAALQHRYHESEGGRPRGGLTVSDGLARRPGHLLFGFQDS